MPICDNHNKNTPTSVATDVDHADAEIAKSKISREQAYFNSYDFDAIEKVSLDETDDVEEAERTIGSGSSISSSTGNNNRTQLTDVADSIGKRGKDGVDLDAGHQTSSGAYLKRLTSYFSGTISRPNKSLKKLNSPTVTPLGQVTVNDSPSGEDSSENQSEGGVSSTGSTRKLYSGDGDDVSCGTTRNNFLLPRAMLKCPSLAGSSSMSSPSTASVAPDKMCNLSGVFNGQNGKVQCCEKVDGRSRERVISASHYSTDKSGSSGYYSSRVCSTSSVEEHIYSEPVVDIVHTRLVPVSNQATLPLQKTLEKQKNEAVVSELEVEQSYYNLRIDSGIRINEELRCLEDSIKNLDRHLKTYSGHGAAPSIRHSDLSSPGSSECLAYDEASVTSAYDKIKNPRPMPTIMEGTDCAPSSLMTRPSWTEDVDDSLMDIDLDSFRLVSEITNKSLRKGERIGSVTGIDNPTFDKTKVLHEEVLENNYKCSKYVNSCPENAYIVESVIESLVGHDFGGSHVGSEGKTSSYYLKRYEDQLHFQSTKDMLEDIRNKVNKLTTSAMGASFKNSGNAQMNGDHLLVSSNHPNHPLPKEFEHYITTLKHELETYLTLMNHCNEMEIRQFCNGLVNNQKLLTITKAFERRRSLASNSSTGLSYEPLRPSSYNPLPYTVSNERIVDDDEDDVTVVSVDPNFQLKRKPRIVEKEIVPHHSFSTFKSAKHVVDKVGTIERVTTVHGSSTLKSMPNLTQLQKNLSLQRPMLDKKSAKLGGKEGAGNDKDSMLEWHKNKPSIWEQYYGTNRMNQTLMGKRGQLVKNAPSVLSYPSSRPESDFTLDLPRAEQLRIKMDKEKKFRQRCRILTTFLSLVFFLLTVMVVSLILTRGKRMFGSML